MEQAKRSTQDKSGFATLVDRVVASATPWEQVYRLENFNCSLLFRDVEFLFCPPFSKTQATGRDVIVIMLTLHTNKTGAKFSYLSVCSTSFEGLSFLSRTFADGQFNCPCIELTKNWEQQLNLLVRQTLIRHLPQVASQKTPKFCQSKP